MITKAPSFVTSDQQTFLTLEAAQGHEIEQLADGYKGPIAEWIMSQRDKIVDILTTTATSKPRARSINGGKKTRKPKPGSADVAAAVNRELQDGKQ